MPLQGYEFHFLGFPEAVPRAVMESPRWGFGDGNVPILGGGLVHMPLAGGRLIDAQEETVVGDQTQTKCVPIWECRIKGPHVPVSPPRWGWNGWGGQEPRALP